MSSDQTRTYERAKCIVFLKTNEAFGGLSNMAGGYPLIVNGVHILTSEALYQVCRFPLLPDVQKLIIEQKSPMSAKMKSKPHRKDSRPDWDQVRVNIMRWCLRVKLAQNWNTFSKLLLDTGEKPIVEHSRKDDFWGAKPLDNQTLVGRNILGRLLMELREAIKNNERDSLLQVEPVSIPDFLLYGRPIQTIIAQAGRAQMSAPEKPEIEKRPVAISNADIQASLFDPVPVKEAPAIYLSTPKAKTSLLSDLKPYAEYKDSGLPWLEKLPSTWTTARTKTRFRLSIEKSGIAHGKELLSIYTHIGVRPRKDLEQKGNKASSTDNYWNVREGDIIVNKLLAWMGAVGVSHYDGVTSPAYDILRPIQQLNSDYYHYLFRTKLYLSLFKAHSRGIMDMRLRLYFDKFGQIPILCPPIIEQAAIVRFLNWAKGRLEKAIRAKRKVIALLNEQKQAIIHRAVTRGLDPSVPHKPSGIPWIGNIPAHWEIRRLKQVCRFSYGDSLPDMSRRGGDISVYGSNGQVGLHDSANTLAPCIIIGRKGSFGKVNFSLTPVFAIDTTFFIDERFTKANLRWLSFLLSILRLDEVSKDAAVPGLDRRDAYQFMVPYPVSNDEQAGIVDYLKDELAQFNNAIMYFEREIELLLEYRTRLVADVVTGKLDVREVAAKLPDEEMPEDIETSSENEISDAEIAV